MCLCGFSLDNLSLMGRTIAVGFVVDDAIVMLENIFRHIEHGMKPMDAAINGRRRDRLHHHIDQLSLIAYSSRCLLMGGIVGRLFREFAICVSNDHRDLGDRLTHAHADDGVALPVGRGPRAREIVRDVIANNPSPHA